MFPPWFFKDEEAVTEAASEALLGTLDYVLLVKQQQNITILTLVMQFFVNCQFMYDDNATANLLTIVNVKATVILLQHHGV